MLRVAKLGGSLLSEEGTQLALKAWLAAQPGQTVLIVGGGEWADLVRSWDQLHGLGDAVSHRLALDCMSLTLNMVHSWFPQSRKMATLPNPLSTEEKLILFDAKNWVLGNSKLPESWDITSDSIAAAVASTMKADELVLLKSCLPSESEVAYVDPVFLSLAKTDRVRFVDLKSSNFQEIFFPVSI
jgi:aspartokinase-like uncharacterized kinase